MYVHKFFAVLIVKSFPSETKLHIFRSLDRGACRFSLHVLQQKICLHGKSPILIRYHFLSVLDVDSAKMCLIRHALQSNTHAFTFSPAARICRLYSNDVIGIAGSALLTSDPDWDAYYVKSKSGTCLHHLTRTCTL